MKIKNDFVTNSSSTSYLICIPSDFNPEKFVEEGFKKYDLDDFKSSKERIISEIIKFIDNRSYYQQDNYDMFWLFTDLFSDYSICSFDTDSDRGEFSLKFIDEVEKELNEIKTRFCNQ